jgi:hypothetical protein
MDTFVTIGEFLYAGKGQRYCPKIVLWRDFALVAY